MEVKTVLKVVALLLLLLLTICGNGRFLYQLHRTQGKENSLKRILYIVVTCCLITGVFCVSQLLLSTIAGGWVLGNAMCQLIGFVDLVLVSGTTSMLALAAVERYFKLLMPSDHTLTFSARNTKLLVTGLFVLSVLLATGPLYGLGEYSHLRGKLTLIVYEGSRSSNTTIEGAFKSNDRGQPNFTSHYLSVLRLAAYLNKKEDPAVQITNYLRTDIGLIARQGRWVHEEIAFVVRAPDMYTLNTVWGSYLDGTLAMNISRVLIDQKLLPLSRKHFLQLRTLVLKDDYLMTKNIHMPIEEMGICSADFTSPNRHNDVWSAYQILVTVLLPYLVSFLSYCAIYRRSPQSLPAMDKAISYDDVWALNILCSTTVICCVLSSTYYAVTLSNANGVAISKDTMFAVLYLYASSWVVLYFMAGISNNTLLDRVRSCLIACGIYAKEAIIYEPDTNYQMRRSSVARSMLGKFTRNDIYKDRSDFKC
ncbi:hypothetical protein ScPMuIL_016232 [Solemya velum]